MQCNCVFDIGVELASHARDKMGAVNPNVSPDFLGLSFSSGGSSIINLTYTLRADNRPWNTQKGKPINMVASFCPFCGKSTKKAEPAPL